MPDPSHHGVRGTRIAIAVRGDEDVHTYEQRQRRHQFSGGAHCGKKEQACKNGYYVVWVDQLDAKHSHAKDEEMRYRHRDFGFGIRHELSLKQSASNRLRNLACLMHLDKLYKRFFHAWGGARNLRHEEFVSFESFADDHHARCQAVPRIKPTISPASMDCFTG